MGGSPYYGQNDILIEQFIRSKPRRENFPADDAGAAAYDKAQGEYVTMIAKLCKSTGATMNSIHGKVSSED